MASILQTMGKPVADRNDVWNNQLPKWDQRLTFQPTSDEGKALQGTVQLQGIMWMLVQHREHLGRKAVRSISVFGGDYPAVYGPTFYIELEDLQSGSKQS